MGGTRRRAWRHFEGALFVFRNYFLALFHMVRVMIGAVSVSRQAVGRADSMGSSVIPRLSAGGGSRRGRPFAGGNGSSGHKRERFELLVDQLSTAMARASVDEIEDQINHWLSRIVSALNVDRGTVWETTASKNGFVSKYWWARPGVPGLPPKMLSARISPWITEKISRGESIAFSSLRELPKSSAALKQFLKTHGPKAMAALPLEVGHEVIGGLTFGKFHGPRDWRPRELQRLRIVAQIFAAALGRKQASLQMMKIRDELVVASRRSTLSQLTASIAHELNQPLAALLSNLGGLARLLSQENHKPAQACSTVRNAIADTKRAAEIVKRLRNMFRAGEIVREPLEVGPLLREVVKLVANESMFRRVALRIGDLADPLWVFGDRIQIQQCVLNLLMNALDAAAQAKTPSPQVDVTAEAYQSGWIELTISDNGTGLDSEIADRIFEPFVTTKTNGMGLGLLVTRSIVERHGGKIWFSPNPYGGSKFSFTLPTAYGMGETARRRAPEVSARTSDLGHGAERRNMEQLGDAGKLG
jgi:signal transduction histidine kinase